MPTTIRQLFVDRLKLRLAAISVANGYQTELGIRPIEEWPVAFDDSELPALGIFDITNRKLQDLPREKKVPNALDGQVRLFHKREETPATLRIMIGDIIKAIITDPATGKEDPTFGGLLVDLKPDEDGFERARDTYEIDGAFVSFTAEFLSKPFSAYE